MKPWLSALASLAGAVAAAALFVVNCTGPRPAVSDVRLEEPKGESDPYVVRATIRNEWHGHGQVAVSVRLRESSGDPPRTFEKQEQVSLARNGSTSLAVEIHAPRARYTPDVQADYPPA